MSSCGDLDGLADRLVLGIEPGLADMIVGQAFAAEAPYRLGKRRRHVRRQAQRLADFADGLARAIVDDGGADGGAVAAIALVDVLDDLLAPLMLEIDIDIGRLVAVLRDEAGEQELGRLRDRPR